MSEISAIEPVTSVGQWVRLEPLGRHHRDGLVASGLDPELYLGWSVEEFSRRVLDGESLLTLDRSIVLENVQPRVEA